MSKTSGYRQLWWRLSRAAGRYIGRGWLALLVLLLYAPILVVMLASLDSGPDVGPAAFLNVPPQDLTLRWYAAISPRMWQAVVFSLQLATMVAVAALLLGVPAALGIARSTPRLYALLISYCRVPLQIPFVVTGVAFLQCYYALASLTGMQLAGSMPGLFIAHLFVATPYVISAVTISVGASVVRLEEAASALGASYLRVLWRVTLPLALPGMFAGGLYAFLVSFTDVTVAVLLGGPGRTTFPVAIMNAIDGELDPSVPAVATVVFLSSMVLMIMLQRMVGLQNVLASARTGH